MPSEVYFSDMRTRAELNLLDKVDRLFDAAGFASLIDPGDFVALKVHVGEAGNTTYVRPQFVRRVVDKVKAASGKPFLTDANTLYRGSRANAVDHLRTAVENGFGWAQVGAPVIIADGLTGRDYVEVEVNLKHFQKVKIGSAAYHADALITISHFKGHEAVGFGGALKNIGMGLGSRAAKQMMHSDLKPQVITDKCTACGRCTRWCPQQAIALVERHSVINEAVCIGCGECTITCPVGAIRINWKTSPEAIQEKIVEHAYGVLKGKGGKAGFLTFIMDVTPECDCASWSDAPLVPNIGILASRDPVAIDQAAADLILQAPGLPGTRLGEKTSAPDKFRTVYPHIDWSVQLAYAEKLGLGTRDYKLIRL
ncbi:MAG: uncharacterized protein PWQ41_856 [Bacillota bacterium]|nr:uncharacterized protein [Bacillota bacterium]MDK2856060.1 uncharacterized protein [Bacillota bacterium]MDK2925082.1 uncharacterized protein [Bacillota bacterium]